MTEADRETLEQEFGQVWDTDDLRRDFEVLGFLAPCVSVRRRVDQVMGTLMFQHQPRLYYAFKIDQP